MTREEIKDFCDMKVQLEPENEDIYKALVKALEQELVLGKITEIIETLRHLPIGEMSDIEWDILRVIDKYKGESEKTDI